MPRTTAHISATPTTSHAPHNAAVNGSENSPVRNPITRSEVASPVTMAWWKGISSGPVMRMWALDEVFTGYYGAPHLDIEGVPDPEHLPWIDPTHPP